MRSCCQTVKHLFCYMQQHPRRRSEHHLPHQVQCHTPCAPGSHACIPRQAHAPSRFSPSFPSSAHLPHADGGSTQDVDPVLEHLIRNARSEAVREEFLRGDMAELIDDHEIRLLVRELPWVRGAGTQLHLGGCPCEDALG